MRIRSKRRQTTAAAAAVESNTHERTEIEFIANGTNVNANEITYTHIITLWAHVRAMIPIQEVQT